uniref:Uncharacterized protein n=1 Tax=Caenorhabditis japonica TaxID=281687 RepID=A0A8R1ESS8_CAEJA
MVYDNRKNAAYAVLNMISRNLLQTCDPFGGCLACPERDLCSIMLIIEKENLNNENLVEFLKIQKITIKLETECDSFAIEKCLSFSIFWFMEKAKWFRVRVQI